MDTKPDGFFNYNWKTLIWSYSLCQNNKTFDVMSSVFAKQIVYSSYPKRLRLNWLIPKGNITILKNEQIEMQKHASALNNSSFPVKA
jgi:hypothetical protein